MAFNATLEIKNKERKLLHFNKGYFFIRPSLLIDWSKEHPFGTHDELKDVALSDPYSFKPVFEPLGGLFDIEVESSDDDGDLYYWFKTTEATHGTIKIYDPNEEGWVMQLIEFWDGWLPHIGEYMSSTSSNPMLLRFRIAAATVRYNSSFMLRHNWWITDIDQQGEPVTSDDEGSISFRRAYWIDDEGNEHEEIAPSAVTLYIEIEGDYSEGDTVSLQFEDETENGLQRCDCEGTINSEGLLVVENFEMKEVRTENES